MKPHLRSAKRAVAVSMLALASCRQPPVVAAPPPPPLAPERPSSQVLDALGAADRTWAYADGRRLRGVVLPDLLRAAGAQRADLEVGLSTLAAKCGFQPLLSIEEVFAAIWRGSGEPTPGWGTALRVQPSLEQSLACLRALAPEAQETSLDGHRAWQFKLGFVAWNDGVFVVASSAFHAHAMMERMAHPEPAAFQARGELAGVLLAANVVGSDSFGLETLRVRWGAAPPGSRLELWSRFDGAPNAMRAETILRDSLKQLLGSTVSLDPGIHGVAERFAQGASMARAGPTFDVRFDMPPLSGETATVTRLTTLAVHGVGQYAAWDLMGEARVAVYDIARALGDYATRVRGLGHPARFPPSAPLVPEDVPYGKRIVPNPHAFLHPSWQDIHFSTDRPTYYALDFVTAKDGRSVVVRARGDIDGDGITSLFELDVALDTKGQPVIAPLIRERDPDE